MVEKMSDLGQTSRAANALLKRQEAIKRWKSSDTNREPAQRTAHQVRITFDKETVFLSAVSSGDVEETRNLLNDGVDINCANVDGLTSLHQACIDENVELVELLVNNDAFLDARDDEGWTPLHAAASAGNVEIAQLLIDNGADILAVNNEGEIPVDLAEEKEMEEFLEDEMEKLGVELDDIRNQEEKIMMEDATSWLNSKNIDEKFNFQGASSLHVAAAKGYHKVMRLLLQAGCDVNTKDKDGWCPLHAAVHWEQQQAAEILTEAGADFSVRNNIGQTPVDIAEGDMIKFVEELRKKVKGRSKDSVDRSNRIIDQQRGSKLRIDVNENDQIRVSFNSAATPLRSAMKGGRDKFNGKASPEMNDTKSSVESGSEGESEEESESDTENEPQRSTNVLLGGPLRPSSLARPPTTASNEKISTQRNPLITSAPLRPSSLINRDNEKRDEGRNDYSNSRDKKDSDKPNRDPLRFTIPRPRDKMDDKDLAIPTTIPRPGKAADEWKKEDLRLKFNIPRPRARNGEKEDSKNEDIKPRVSRFTRGEEKDDENKRPISKADEIRAKFNIPKPGDSLASSALSRYRERNSEQEDSKNPRTGADDDKKVETTRNDDPIASLRARRALLTGPLRPNKPSDTTKDDKPENEPSSSLRSRLEHDREFEREETISIRKKFTDRKEAEKEKEVEKKDEKREEEDDDEDSANLSAQRARRSRRPREKRKATGVAYMPDEDDDVDEEKRETRHNTKANEDYENKKNEPTSTDDEPPRLSISERLRRSRENREGPSSTNVTALSSNRTRDLISSSKAESNDSRELQRRLKEALSEVEDYKAKLEKSNKEKEELKEKLVQCEEAMKKMKDENGALIRVISTLTRSNAS